MPAGLGAIFLTDKKRLLIPSLATTVWPMKHRSLECSY